MTHLNDIEKLAMETLTPEERNILADRLWRSTHGEEDEYDPEFLAELERRVKAVQTGTATLYAHDTVMAELRARCK